MLGNKTLTTVVILALIIGDYASKPAAAAPSERYFPETGHAIKGAFQSYWEQHGGLERFGYPLSDEFAEVSALNGQTYTVQYFERAEFEHHPENAAPYNVLLTQLGTLGYKARYAIPPSTFAVSCDGQYFPETDKCLSADMLDTWQRLGGLMGIGYPMSNEFYEISEVDGKNYKVQYFERAEFEYHNEQQPPMVMLAHLGRFRYNERYIAQGSAPYLVGSNSRYAYQVVAGGHYIFWIGENWVRHDGCESECVYGYDIATQHIFVVDKTNLGHSNLQTDGKWLLWRSYGVYDYGIATYYISKDAVSGAAPFSSAGGAAGTLTDTFTLADGILYYERHDRTYHGIYARNVATSAEQLISANGEGPQASGGTLMWRETDASGAVSLHLLKAGDPAGAKVVAQGSKGTFLGYKVSANKAAWVTSNSAGGVEITLYDISTSTSLVIPTTNIGEWVMSDNKLAWVVPQNQIPSVASAAIWTYDISSGLTSTALKDVVGDLHLSSIMGEGNLVFSTANNIYILNLVAAVVTGGNIPEPTPAVKAKDVRLLDKDVESYKACGSYVVWQRGKYGAKEDTLYGYNADTSEAFTITDQPSHGERSAVTCDNKILLWREKDEGSKVHVYDVANHHELMSLNLDGVLAVGDGTIYSARDKGIYAYTLVGGETKLVAGIGDDIVRVIAYSAGTLLWSADDSHGVNSLHLLKLDGSVGDTTIAKALDIDDFFQPTEISGDYTAWSYLSLSPGKSSTYVILYQISTAEATQIDTGQFTQPHIGGNKVTWLEHGGTIKVYNIGSGDTITISSGLPLADDAYIDNPPPVQAAPRPVGQNGVAFVQYGWHGYSSLYLAILK